MMRILFIVCAVAFAAIASGGRVSYAGHRVVSLPLDEAGCRWLASLREPSFEAAGVTKEVDVWSFEGTPMCDGTTQNVVRLCAESYYALLSLGLPHAVLVADLERHHNAVSRADATRHSSPDWLSRERWALQASGAHAPADEWYYHWHSFAEIQARIRDLAAKHPNIVTYFDVGVSHENRTFGGLHITGDDSNVPKKRVVFVAGTHAREWIAEGVAMWIIASLVEPYESDPEIRRIVNSIDLFIVPCYNPDGYEYSRNTDRYWRKNRRVNGDRTYGVDQNRNWNANWGGAGASRSPSSDTYCGPSELSEPETRAVRDWLITLEPRSIAGFIDFHSYAELFLRPWAYKSAVSADEAKLKVVGDEFVRTVNKAGSRRYTSIRASELYVCSGSAGDGAYVLDINYPYVIELAGNDFVVPESEISKQGAEVFQGVKYFFNAI